MKNYYKILHVSRDASDEQIRQRFKELALEYHPDVSIHDRAHDIFVEINEAYHILSDPEKKAAYDLLYDHHYAGAIKKMSKQPQAETNLQYYATHARNEAQKKAKIRYTEYLKHANCYFTNGLKADGCPFSYFMHKTTGITGGTGPLGSIRSKAVRIPIPRSKKAVLIHRTGFGVKFFFLILAVCIFLFDLVSVAGYIIQVIISLLLILLGGSITHLIYKKTGVQSKVFATKYFLVIKYKKKGYERGFHPIVSTTPIGLIILLFRWIL